MTKDIVQRNSEHQAACQAIKLASKVFPRLRVTQLISNAVDSYHRDHDLPLSNDLFYIEDTILVVALYEYMANHGRSEL